MDSFAGMAGDVKAIAVHPLAGEGPRFIYAAGEGGEIKKWDDTGFLYPTAFKGHTATVICLLLNEAGDTLVSGAADKKIIVWRGNGEKLKEITTLYSSPRCMIIKDDALVVADSVGDIYVFSNWNGEEPPTHTVLRGHRDIVSHIRAHDSGFYTCSYDGTVRQWDFAAGKVLAVFSGHDGHVRGLAIAKEHLITASRDGTVRVWPVPPPSEEATSAKRVECIGTVEYDQMPSLVQQRGASQTFMTTSDGQLVQLDAAMLVETAVEYIAGNKKAFAEATRAANAAHAQYVAKQKKRCKKAVRKEQDRLAAEAAAAAKAAETEKAPAVEGEEAADEPPPAEEGEEGEAAGPKLSPEAHEELKRLTAELTQKYDALIDAHERKTEGQIAGSELPSTYDVPADRLWSKPFSRSLAKTRESIAAIFAAETPANDVYLYYAHGNTLQRKKCNPYTAII